MDALTGRLKERRDRLCGDLGLPSEAGAAVFADLAERYAGPDRHYHTLSHLADVLDWLDRLAAPAAPSAALRLAAWFHDAVYDPRAADNEERSAALARERLAPLGLPAALPDEVARLILLTKTHTAADADYDGLLLLDADLAVLGADLDAYDAYAAAVRREYAWVPEEAWRSGRRRVLEGFLRREHLFRSGRMDGGREAAALANLRREAKTLAVAEAAAGGPGGTLSP
jgi:predicted metal-dependent HD superfamily phosphohydrolase